VKEEAVAQDELLSGGRRCLGIGKHKRGSVAGPGEPGLLKELPRNRSASASLGLGWKGLLASRSIRWQPCVVAF